MGLELLDMTFRAEKRFRVKLELRDFVRIAELRKNQDLTAGDFHDWVCHACGVQSAPVPSDSWEIVQAIITEATGVDPDEIRKESLLRSDLGAI